MIFSQNEDGKGATAGLPSTPTLVYMIAIFSSISGFLFGYDTGVISGSLHLIRSDFRLNTVWTHMMVSVPVGSAAIFSIFAGYLMDLIGRRRTMIGASAVFAIAGMIMCASPNKEVLLVGRVVIGVAIALSSVCEPVYIAEVAPSHIRGTLVAMNQLFVAIGIFVSSHIAGGFSEFKESGWRYMFCSAMVPALVQCLVFRLNFPESPRWLMTKGYEDKALCALIRIRGTYDVEEEMMSLQHLIEKPSSNNSKSTLLRVLRTPHVRRALSVGIGLQVFEELCGVNAVIYYSASIIRMAGFSVTKSIWLALIPNTANLVAMLIGIYLIDRLGRRILLLTSIAGVTIALVILATGFKLSSIYAPPLNVTEIFDNITYQGPCNTMYSNCDECTSDNSCGFCYDVTSNGSCLPVDHEEQTQSMVGRCNVSDLSETSFIFAYGSCPNSFMWLPVFGLALFLLMFAPGLGPIPWTVNSEIYPLWARGTCTAITGATTWTFSLIVLLTFLTLTETITKYGTIWLFGGISVLGFLFVLAFLPETKNKTLEEVEKLFMTSGSRGEKAQLLPQDFSSHPKYEGKNNQYMIRNT